ncbi:hypothetical protein I79_026062 [Cricetulus griseus]|uniref:Uncharacterized protein n=1 Tax=Cricetulus griseus TaxID=10029 RepID=G3IPX7_CRIGR|nr:hypothetical protein I79_026062 [Cricetulus griseus]
MLNRANNGSGPKPWRAVALYPDNQLFSPKSPKTAVCSSGMNPWASAGKDQKGKNNNNNSESWTVWEYDHFNNPYVFLGGFVF